MVVNIMAPKVQAISTLKYLLLFVVAVLSNCGQSSTSVVVNNTAKNKFVINSDPFLKRVNGVWFYKNEKLNATIIEIKNDDTIANIPVLDGKENGLAKGWFDGGEKRYEKFFEKGQKNGIHKLWYKNGQLAGLNFYKNDKLDSTQLSFFESGNLWQELHYVNGQEEGKQKTWNDSGRIINNFTVKNGKLYGVIGRYDCMSVMQK
jgi:antitoxin component YwqK of YwqJK toxin-antitoxin module